MAAFSHRARSANPASCTISDTPGLPSPNGASACSSSASSSRAPRRRRSHRRARPPPRSSRPSTCSACSPSAAANARRTRARSPAPRPRDGRRSAQLRAAGGQPRQQVERLDRCGPSRGPAHPAARSARPGAGGARPGARRRCRSPPDASPRRRARRRRSPAAGHLRFRLDADLQLDLPALAVCAVELCGDLPGARGVPVRISSSAASARYIRPAAFSRGASAKGDRALVERPGPRAATAISARRPGLAVRASARSPARTSARFSPRAHHVGDRGERHQIEVAAGAARLAPAAAGGGAQAPARACAPPPSRTAAGRGSRRRRVHDLRRRQRAVLARRVVIADHHLHPQLARERDLLDGRDRAVDGDQQPGAALSQPAHGRARSDRSRRGAVGHVPVDLGAQRAQRGRAPRSRTRRPRRSRRAW